MEPLVLMEKEAETGFLVKEVDTYNIDIEENLIDRIYMIKTDGKNMVNLHLTTGRDEEDWEFSAIFDCYNHEALENKVLTFEEVDECYSPTWEIIFEFIENHSEMLEFLNEILNIHKEELERVYVEIKDKKDEYV